MRKAGILMPVSSLPDRFGCGDFGKQAYHFVDTLAQAGIGIWQILPLNPMGYGHSPYQPYSSYAMDEIYISLDTLVEQGYLQEVPSFNEDADTVDYEAVRAFKEPYLKEAFSHFKEDMNFVTFSYQPWMKNYALFKTFKKINHNAEWTEWPEEQKNYPLSHALDLTPYTQDILYEVFLQYILYLQWKDLKQYANDRDIEIMGDMPFYVGLDSADVWADREAFLLDKDGRPEWIAGVPPDYFSATGQRWGNPIYNWEYLQQTEFQFWIDRISYCGKLMDYVRIDHFRAFDTYWKIPASCPTAIEGEWVEAPGYALFDTLFAKNPEVNIICEDLGDLRPEVYTLRDHYQFPGMRVIQFAFGDNDTIGDRENLIVYTGTHDNTCILDWYNSQSVKEKKQIRTWLKDHGYTQRYFIDNILAYALDTQAKIVIIPIFDFLHENHARINTPGTINTENWTYRIKNLKKWETIVEKVHRLVEQSHRVV